MASNIPEEVQRLIYQHLPSMDHVELLLFLVRSGAESRSVPEILARVTTHADTAEEKLGELVQAGLAAADTEGGIRRYRYAPAGLRQRLAVEGLTEAYDTRPVSLIRMIYERPPDAAQKFADAFLFRKPKE